VNAHGDQLIRLRMSEAQLLKLPDKLRRHAMNAERNQLVRVQPLQVLVFYLPREMRVDIVNRSVAALFLAVRRASGAKDAASFIWVPAPVGVRSLDSQ
jgi:hypothetical protein